MIVTRRKGKVKGKGKDKNGGFNPLYLLYL
jgi:hypothetical protein